MSPSPNQGKFLRAILLLFLMVLGLSVVGLALTIHNPFESGDVP